MKKLILILISVVCISGCAHNVRLYDGDYMIIEKSTRLTKDIHRYKISTKMKNGVYKIGHSVVFAPAHTYAVGDTLYFTSNTPTINIESN